MKYPVELPAEFDIAEPTPEQMHCTTKALKISNNDEANKIEKAAPNMTTLPELARIFRETVLMLRYTAEGLIFNPPP